MSRYYRETEDCHAVRKHCKTCVCQEVDSVRRLSSPRSSPHRSPYTCVKRHQGHCRRCHHSPADDWQESEVFKEHHHVFSHAKIERKIPRDHKFTILEKWFKEFDFDGNGLIDVYELQQLLEYLGVKCDQEYVKDLIEDSDRDHDGMLSFSDFLYMWSQAACEDVEYLNDLVKEHALYPDILPTIKHHKPKLRNLSIQAKELRKHEPHHEYSCCEYVSERKSVDRSSIKARELQIKSKFKCSPSRCSDDDFPLLSCHR